MRIAYNNAYVYVHKRWPASCEHNAKPTKDFQMTATPAKHSAGQVLDRPYVNAAFKVLEIGSHTNVQ